MHGNAWNHVFPGDPSDVRYSLRKCFTRGKKLELLQVFESNFLLLYPAPITGSQVMVHANNHEMLNVSDWRAWVETHLCPVVGGLRGQRVHKEIFLAVGNEALAPWHVEMFGRRLVPCMKEV